MLGERIKTLIQSVWREAAKFGVIGVLNTFVDIGLFNYLAGDGGPLDNKITTAKFISGGVATVFAWIGNRYWTFRHRRNRPVHHEVLLFFIVNGIALGLSTAWVAFAHYTLGLQGTLWLNINAFIGIGIGTVFRFWAYKKYVFANEPVDTEPVAEALTDPMHDGAVDSPAQRHSA
ncbi:GtrA family protein [Flexivirga meconopsidis]|uniref:GtrA family protein n=1 Tax=Flexivirga meconopsidis TaxID=2977121 RepID=UPI002240D695